MTPERRKELSWAARKRAEHEEWLEQRANAVLPPEYTTLKVALRYVFNLAQEATGGMSPAEMDDWRQWLTTFEKSLLKDKAFLSGRVVRSGLVGKR
jgi:hypothetical protein